MIITCRVFKAAEYLKVFTCFTKLFVVHNLNILTKSEMVHIGLFTKHMHHDISALLLGNNAEKFQILNYFHFYPPLLYEIIIRYQRIYPTSMKLDWYNLITFSKYKEECLEKSKLILHQWLYAIGYTH